MCGVDAFVDILLKCSFEIQVFSLVPYRLAFQFPFIFILTGMHQC
jgi:hypothetical protein